MQSASVAASGEETDLEGVVVPSGPGSTIMSYATSFMERQSMTGDRSFKIWAAGARLLPKIWRVRGLEQAAAIGAPDEVAESRISEERSQLGREIREALLDLGPAFVKGGQLL
jgi:predicted unusual protein kinase regulating ubiquinone biosynthesis (AarF/ABC1/UbiB family)